MLADRFNHRYLVSISIILCATATVMVSQAQSVYLLIIFLSILTFFSTFYHPAAFSFTSELFDASQRNRALGIHGTGGIFGTSIGPITLGLLMAYIGWRMPIGLSTILFGLVSTMGLLSASIGGCFSDKLRDKKWLTITFSSLLLTISGVALSSSIYFLTTFYLLNGFFQFAGMAANSSLVARFTPKSMRGLGYGLFFLPTNLVGSISPLVSSVIVSNFGIWYVFPLAFGVYVVATLLLQAIPNK